MELSIVSYNLRYIFTKDDGVNSFIHRAGMILEKIEAEQPEIICFQECMKPHGDFFRKHLIGYQFVYNQRNADYSGEGLAFAVKSGVIELYGLDVFWLSPTPRVPGSRFQIQSGCPRICQCIMLRDLRDGKLFRLYNTHLDHFSDQARILGVKEILDYAAVRQAEYELPFFLLGDFNALPYSETVRYCDEFKELPIVDLTRNTGGTWHDFGRLFTDDGDNSMKIDYIYADAETAKKPFCTELWKDEFNGIYLSDHYPVALKIEL